jgi:hypothetical protein
MLEEIENALEELTIAYNIAQQFFEDDTEAKIGYFEQIVLGVILDLRRVVDESKKPRVGSKQVS